MAAAIYFGALALLDMPKPHVDDLFYTGAALNMASGGDFSNPLLARQEFPSRFFFVYPPLESYVLCGWLKLFGISTASVLAYAAAINFITAASVIWLLQKHGAPGLLKWLVPLGVSACLLNCGLRPEPLAIALTSAGFALFESNPQRRIVLFFSFLLMGLGASGAPRVVAFSAVIMLFAGFELLFCRRAAPQPSGADQAPVSGSARFRIAGVLASIRESFCVPDGTISSEGLSVTAASRHAAEARLAVPLLAAAGGVACAVFLFLLMIHFRLAEFWRIFHFHASRLGKPHHFKTLSEFLGLNRPLFLLVFALLGFLVFAWPRQADRLKSFALALLAAFPLQAIAHGLTFGPSWYGVLALLLLAGAVLKQPVAGKLRIYAVLAAGFIFANAVPFVRIYGRATRHITYDRGSEASQASALRTTHKRAVLLDFSVARYVFSYRIPSGMFDFRFGDRFPGSFAVLAMRPGDTYLVGPETVRLLNFYTHLNKPIREWAPVGTSTQIPSEPCKVFIVPEEECNGLRPEFRQVSNTAPRPTEAD